MDTISKTRRRLAQIRLKAEKSNRMPVVMIILPNRLGDIIMSTVIIDAVKRKYPESTLIYAMMPAYFALLQHHPSVDHLEAVTCVGQVRELNKLMEVDKCLTLMFSDVDCPYCGQVWKHPSSLLEGLHFDNWYKKGRHLVEFFADMADVEWQTDRQRLYLPPDQPARSREFMVREGIDLNRPIVCFHTQTPHWPAKQWDLTNFVELGWRLRKTHNAQIVLLGTEPVRWPVDGPSVYNFTTKLSIIESAAVIQSSNLFVGLDSGPSHIAAAVGTPSVLIYGGTAPETCHPLAPNVSVIHLKEACNPCFIHRLDQCVLPSACITRTTVDSVFASATQSLGSTLDS